MNKAAYILSFICGAVVGAVWMAHRKEKNDEKETEAAETIELKDDSEPDTDEIIIPEANDNKKVKIVSMMNDIIQKSGYNVGDHTNDVDDGPYVIAPDEFGDFEDYDAISMTLTSDGVLLDSDLSKVEDPENSVGANYMNYFGVYPDDPYSVYIRNDDLCCDFEIVKDLRTFAEIDADIPHMKWRKDE